MHVTPWPTKTFSSAGWRESDGSAKVSAESAWFRRTFTAGLRLNEAAKAPAKRVAGHAAAEKRKWVTGAECPDYANSRVYSEMVCHLGSLHSKGL